MSDLLHSVSVACAVTALEILGSEFLLVGSGPYINVYPLFHSSERKGEDELEDILHRERIFHSEVVHKIVVRRMPSYTDSGTLTFEVVVIGKSLVNLYIVQSPTTSPPIAFSLLHRLRSKEGRELVLDAVFLGDLYVAIGLGSNEVSIHRKADGAEVARYQSSARSGLFSMAIDLPGEGICDRLCVASGNAFGSIFIWDVDVSNVLCANNDGSKIEPAHKLSGHDGFVFKLRWSPCGEWLASGSDDRSVRVWRAGPRGVRTKVEQVFVGWGHTCRVWDVLFIRESLLVSSSEDLTVRIWDYKHNIPISTITAHVGRHVWCVAYHPTFGCMYSGGNDSSVKVWNIELCMYLSRDSKAPPSIDASEFAIAHDISGITTLQSVSDVNSKTAVIIAVKMSPYTEDVVFVYASGRIATCCLIHGKTAGFVRLLTDVAWGPTLRIETETTANAAAIHFVEDSNKSTFHAALGLHDGSAALALISSYKSVWHRSWKAHTYKISGVWIAKCSVDLLHVFTASVGGEVKLWEISVRNVDDILNIDPQLVVCVTNAKKQMASACLLLRSGSIVVGGCKGCLSYFDHCSIEAYKEGFERSTNIQGLEPTFARMHSMGTSPIAEIVECRSGFIVSGHDGHVNVYVITQLNEFRISQTLSTSSIAISDSFYLPSAYLPQPDGGITESEATKLRPFCIGGFQSSAFEVWDISAKYCHMRVNGGGWRRLHSSSVRYPSARNATSTNDNALPDASFVSVDATGKVPVLKAYSYRVVEDVEYKGAIIKSFGKISNGRVMYAGTFIAVHCHQRFASSEVGGNNLKVTGSLSSLERTPNYMKRFFVGAGEEGVIKVYDIPSLDVVQEVLFPGQSLVRSLSSATLADGTGVLIAAGGRLAHAVWSYRSASTSDGMNQSGHSETRQDASNALGIDTLSALGSVLQCEYSHDPAAEHRGLCSACWCDGSSDDSCEYLIGDSRGIVRHFRFVKFLYSATALHEFVVSECPVLCCKVIVVPGYAAAGEPPITIAFFGDTAGFIYIYRLNSDRKGAILLRKCKIQMMGTDALEVAVLHDAINELSKERVVEIVIFTGGDDQSVGVLLLKLRISASTIESDILAAVRVDGVCGSAVHAMSILRINASRTLADLACASLDQRLYFWQCDLVKTGELYKLAACEEDGQDQPSCTIAGSCNAFSEVSPLKWRSGDVLHTADVGAMGVAPAHQSIAPNHYDDSNTSYIESIPSNDSKTGESAERSPGDDSYCVVVGEGIQVFKFRLGGVIA